MPDVEELLAAARKDPSLLPRYDSLTPEVLERAARRPDAPPRLKRVLDAVLDGKFSWAEAASGETDHPTARNLLTPRARFSLAGLFDEVAAEPVKSEKKKKPEPDDEFGGFMEDSFDVPER